MDFFMLLQYLLNYSDSTIQVLICRKSRFVFRYGICRDSYAGGFLPFRGHDIN